MVVVGNNLILLGTGKQVCPPSPPPLPTLHSIFGCCHIQTAPRGQIQAAATLGTNKPPSPPSQQKSALAAHPPPHPLLPKIFPSPPPQIMSGWVVQTSDAPASGSPHLALCAPHISLTLQGHPPLPLVTPLVPRPPSRYRFPVPPSSSPPRALLLAGMLGGLSLVPGAVGSDGQRAGRDQAGDQAALAAQPGGRSRPRGLISFCHMSPTHTHTRTDTHALAATFPPPSCGKRRPAPTPPPVKATA